VTSAHGRALELVASIQARADALARRFDTSIGSFEEHVGAVEHASFLWAVLFLGGATLFAAGVGLYLGNSVARPVARLTEGASRLAQGDLSTRIPEGAPDEFGRLAAQFNRMTEALRTHQEQLVQHEKLAASAGWQRVWRTRSTTRSASSSGTCVCFSARRRARSRRISRWWRRRQSAARRSSRGCWTWRGLGGPRWSACLARGV